MSKKTAQKINRLYKSDLITIGNFIVSRVFDDIQREKSTGNIVISFKSCSSFVDINGKPCRIIIEALDGLSFAERYPNRNKDIDLPF